MLETIDTLVVSTVFAVLAGALYAYVGFRLMGRKVSAENRPAHQAFVGWWFALALMSLLGASQIALYRAGHLPVWIYQTLGQVGILLLLYALASLTYYLVFLYTGSQRWVGWISAYYLLFFVFLEGLVFYIGAPQAISDNGWRLTTLPETVLPRPVGLAFAIVLLGPQVVCSVAYARLYKRASDATQRYRIAMVAGSIIVWFGSSLVASALQAVGPTWQVISKLISVAAAAAILLAYLPPKAWQVKWHLRSITQEATAA